LAECTPLDFGGRTLQDPCSDWLGFCKLEDWDAVREVLLLEHNGLVRSLNQWNKLVGEGKASWSPLPTHAWQVYEASGATLEKYTHWIGDVFSPSAAVLAMMQQAMAVHAATCDLDGELEAIGQPIPAKPQKPVEPKSITQEVTDFIKEGAKSVGMLFALGLLGWAGYNWLSSGGGSRR
jgi:hypothetical protein